MIRLGVDVGGTFTDLVLIDDTDGSIHFNKVPTTPHDPSEGTLDGALEICRSAGVDPGAISQFFHGTTIATNILLEHTGAKAGMLTTEGYRDILHIARHKRPFNFSIQQDLPWQSHPLVRRRYRLPIRERIIAPKGDVLIPLDEAQVREAVRKLKDKGVEAVAVCLMFSFLNPDHERRIGEIVREEWPEVHLSLSHEVIPQYREYERFSTTCLNAYVGPKTTTYLHNLDKALKDKGFGAELHLMQSGGGVATVEGAVNRPVALLMSGPVAGLIGGIWAAGLADHSNVITLDVGGTSADIGVAPDGNMSMKHLLDTRIGDYQAMIPMVDIDTIGAGGGSIAYVDGGGLFRVGPRSAGAVPGPCCYGRGGELPTTTDCNAVLGRLNPDNFLGGRMPLRTDLAQKAVETHLCGPLGMGLEEAALGALKILNHSMIQSIEMNSVRKGYDPREFALVAFGGAGPLHACEVAQELSIPVVIIPLNPGLTSALGLLTTDISYDFSQTQFQLLSDPDLERIRDDFQRLEHQAEVQLERDDIQPDRRTFLRIAECRYQGQGYELRVDAPSGAIDQIWVEGLIRAFHATHDREYSRHFDDKDIELVNIRVVGIGRIPNIATPTLPLGGEDPDSGALTHHREVVFGDGGRPQRVSTPHFDRTLLKADNVIRGPAIIEQADTTTLLPPGLNARVEPHGNLVINLLNPGGTS